MEKKESGVGVCSADLELLWKSKGESFSDVLGEQRCGVGMKVVGEYGGMQGDGEVQVGCRNWGR